MISLFPITAGDFLNRLNAGLSMWEYADGVLVWFGTNEQLRKYEELSREVEPKLTF